MMVDGMGPLALNLPQPDVKAQVDGVTAEAFMQGLSDSLHP